MRVVSAVVVLALLVAPGAAAADPVPFKAPEDQVTEPPPATPPASCSPAPEALADPGPEDPPVDPVVAEIRRLRIESVEGCRAASDRADEVRGRLWWVVAELVEANAAAIAANGKLQQLVEAPDCGDPCRVHITDETVPTEEASSTVYSDEIVSAIDSSGEASKAGLWFLAGLAVMAILGYPIYQAFIFWRRDV
jgi:hypothetical protein